MLALGSISCTALFRAMRTINSGVDFDAMFTHLRYSLATIFFAFGVGCLALWWRSIRIHDIVFVQTMSPVQLRVGIDSYSGLGEISLFPNRGGAAQQARFQLTSLEAPTSYAKREIVRTGWFWRYGSRCRFPLWYPALIFALAGIASLRLGRRFTIRSAIIAMTVVANLFGMAVAL